MPSIHPSYPQVMSQTGKTIVDEGCRRDSIAWRGAAATPCGTGWKIIIAEWLPSFPGRVMSRVATAAGSFNGLQIKNGCLAALVASLGISLIGCRSDPDRDGDNPIAAEGPKAEQPAAVSRDEIKFISRPSEKTAGGVPLLDLLLKVGDNEIRIARAENSWSEVPADGSKAPEDAIVAARTGYAGGADWFFVVEENGRYLLKFTSDDEGAFEGEGSVVGDITNAKVFAEISKTGETIGIQGFNRDGE